MTLNKGYTKADYIRAAAEGLTKAETAARFGVSTACVSIVASRHGIEFSRHVRLGRPRQATAAPARSQIEGLTPEQRADIKTLTTLGRYTPEQATAIVTRPKVKICAPRLA